MQIEQYLRSKEHHRAMHQLSGRPRKTFESMHSDILWNNLQKQPQLSDWFSVESGVQQECAIPPIVILVATDRIIRRRINGVYRKTKKSQNVGLGIQNRRFRWLQHVLRMDQDRTRRLPLDGGITKKKEARVAQNNLETYCDAGQTTRTKPEKGQGTTCSDGSVPLEADH